MHKKWLSLILLITIFNIVFNQSLVNAKNIKTIKKVNQKIIKNQRFKLSNNQVTNNLISSIKLEDVVQPIKKLTRKRMIKLLIKSIKRVNKNSKKLNKSDTKLDNKSTDEFRPTLEQTRNSLRNSFKKSFKNGLENSLEDQQIQTIDEEAENGLKNHINLKIKESSINGQTLINRNSPALNRREKLDPFNFIPKYTVEPNNQWFVKSTINNQQIPFLADPQSLLNTQQIDEHVLYTNLNDQFVATNRHEKNEDQELNLDRSLNDMYNLNDKQSLNDKLNLNDKYYLNKFNLNDSPNSLTQNEDQIIRIHIPLNELIHYPIYVQDQLNSTNIQNLFKNFIRSQLDHLTTRSDQVKRELFNSKFLNFITRQLDIDLNNRKSKELVLQTGLTKIVGAFVGKFELYQI